MDILWEGSAFTIVDISALYHTYASCTYPSFRTHIHTNIRIRTYENVPRTIDLRVRVCARSCRPLHTNRPRPLRKHRRPLVFLPLIPIRVFVHLRIQRGLRVLCTCSRSTFSNIFLPESDTLYRTPHFFNQTYV